MPRTTLDRGGGLRSIVILMIENEQPDGLSARKLVAETAHHNVLTAYSAKAGMQLLQRFPNVDAVLVHSEILSHRQELLSEIKAAFPRTPVILASPFGQVHSPLADYAIDSHRPNDLMKLLEQELQA